MNYTKLGVFLTIGVVGTLIFSLIFKEGMADFTDRLILAELLQFILWCFIGKDSSPK